MAKNTQDSGGQRDAVFHRDFLDDLLFWVDSDMRVARRLLELWESVLSSPFEGLGKPEPLRQPLTGIWSRRLTLEHRVVYQVSEDRIVFLQARFHYQ